MHILFVYFYTFNIFHIHILIILLRCASKYFIAHALNNVLRKEANWKGHILRRNCLFDDAIEGQMTEVKGVGRRITQLLDNLRNRTRHWELHEEAEGPRRWK